MNPYYPIYTEKAECQDCYKCVRQCPTKAINVLNGNASIIEERCVLCGTCVQACPVGAKHVRNDIHRAQHLLRRKDKVVVSLAPSFISEFTDMTQEQLIGALKKLGFYGVSETALGAQEVSAHVAKKMQQPDVGIQISTACPTVVQMVQKYYPQHAELLTDLYSPVLAHSVYLRKIYGDDISIVFLGPCIAKKSEADEFENLLDLSLTFEGVRLWFAQEGIDPTALAQNSDNNFIPERAEEGALYPIDGGMISSVKAQCSVSDSTYMAFSGMEEIDAFLSSLDDAPQQPLFLELLACKGGCVNGPRTTCKKATAFKRLNVLDFATTDNDALPRPISYSIENKFDSKAVKDEHFDEEAIRETLKKIGKNSINDELNCSGCGYDSCRDFVAAILDGKAERDMCVSYMRELAHKKANALIKAMPSGVVIVDEHLRVVECNRNFSRILGEDVELVYDAKPGMKGANLQKLLSFSTHFQNVLESGEDMLNKNIDIEDRILNGSIFTIEKNRIVGGVFQDITAPAIQKEQIISKTKEVIEKNLSTVQQIAYLLGENASETEVLLDSITQSFRADSLRK
jgi:iron only hydrogenase large subunit-like protein